MRLRRDEQTSKAVSRGDEDRAEEGEAVMRDARRGDGGRRTN
jgi:hypothetical protein